MADELLTTILSPRTKAPLAIVLRRNFSGEKHNFLTPPQSSLQLGVNFYGAGEIIRSHKHKKQERRIGETQEFLMIAEGSAVMLLYDEGDALVCETPLNAGDCVLLLAGGHGFRVLDKTKIIEIKQGPYLPENDKVYLPGS